MVWTIRKIVEETSGDTAQERETMWERIHLVTEYLGLSLESDATRIAQEAQARTALLEKKAEEVEEEEEAPPSPLNCEDSMTDMDKTAKTTGMYKHVFSSFYSEVLSHQYVFLD